MVTIVGNPRDIPADMILMPGGREMNLREFWLQHGDDLRPFMNARIAVATAGFRIPDDAGSAMEAMIGVVVTGIVGVLLRKKPAAASVVAPVMAAYVAKDAVAWVKHHTEHGRTVRIYTLHELFPQIREGQIAGAGAR